MSSLIFAVFCVELFQLRELEVRCYLSLLFTSNLLFLPLRLIINICGYLKRAVPIYFYVHVSDRS